tara:strand:+ start:1864 stop:2817 length:954 start_codon:yes stop_codon:yes gene_type:complete
MNKIMIIDMLNMYFRAYIVDPSLSTNGQPIGGIKGTLKIMQKMLREMKPSQVYLCWDGRQGSSKRKKVNSNYKEGRKPLKLNRSYDNLTDDQQLKNMIWQQTRLIEYFNSMPFCQIMIEHTEADDVIGFLCNQLKDKNKMIISSDKDFFQLLDDTTILYRPIQKELLNKYDIIEKNKIHPRNYTLARSMVGDKSDNIEGIRGVGMKSLSKKFPILSEDRDVTIDEFIGECKKSTSNLKIYSNIIENEKKIRENYSIMQLYNVNISPQSAAHIRNCVKNYPYDFNKTEVMKMMLQDGFAEIKWDSMFAQCRFIGKGEK